MMLPSGSIPTLAVDPTRMSAVGILSVIEDATQRLGDIVLLRFPGDEEIVLLGSIEHVRFWRLHPEWFCKPVDTLPSSAAVGRLILEESLTTARDGDEWLRLRRLTEPRVRPTIAGLRTAMAAASDWLVGELRQAADPILMADACMNWSLKMVSTPLLGESVTEPEIMEVLDRFRTVYFEFISRVDKDNVNQLREGLALASLHASFDALVDGALSRSPPNEQSMLADLYRQLAAETTPLGTQRLLRSIVFGTLASSVDNLAAALLWNLIHLAREPRAAAQIAAEAWETERADWDLATTPIALAAVRESLRLTPIQPLVERATTTRMVVSGCTMDAGTHVFFSPWLVQRDARNWSDPLRYDVDRFLTVRRPDPASYFPFGGDKRICVGQNLALHQLTRTVSQICKHLEFSISGRCKPGHLKPVLRLKLAPRGAVVFDIATRIFPSPFPSTAHT